MSTTTIPHPPVVSRAQWRAERLELLQKEKAATRERDRVSAIRRRLPMVRLETHYQFEGPDGPRDLAQLFEGRRQLIIYHFMFDPAWEKGCPGCTGFVDSLGDLSLLAERETSFALISRAPYEKLARYREERGWRLPWYSSFGSPFNYDFHVTLDEAVGPVEYNYRSKAELMEKDPQQSPTGEAHGLSVFFRMGDELFHTYSSYARGVENLTDSYSLLDVTPYGRQEDWEDSPDGWPQRPTYG